MIKRRSQQGFRAPHLREHFVYRAYDARGWLLYVGCTKQPTARWREHVADRKWAPKARRFRLAGPYTYATARDLEHAALRDENPKYGMTPAKKTHAARTGKPVNCYRPFTPPGHQTARIDNKAPAAA